MPTPREVYNKYRALYSAHCLREREVLAAAYPETGGVSLYVHNWIVCGGTTAGREPGASEKARALVDSLNDKWRRISARNDREYARAEHAEHERLNRAGQYLWCQACQ